LVYTFFDINFIWGFITQGFMSPLHIAEMGVFFKASAGFRDRQILMKINLLELPPKNWTGA
jgi:hypothetical protein